MADRLFYVGAQDDSNALTGLVPAKFLTVDGKPVVDPAPGGSQKAYIYYDPSSNGKMDGRLANPNNYLIAPANYTEQHAREFAGQVARTLKEGTPGAGLARALAQMADAFPQGRPEDLQRHPRWGIPKGSVVPAFVGSASYHLGRVTRLAGLPLTLSKVGGAIPNLANAWLRQPARKMQGKRSSEIDTSGPYGLSRQNYDNIERGYADAGRLGAATPPTEKFGYTSGITNGKIGDGYGIGPGDWRYTLAGIDPSNPIKPASPPLADEIGSMRQTPVRYLSGRAVPHPLEFETGSQPLRFVPFEYLLGLKPDFDERFPRAAPSRQETIAPSNIVRSGKHLSVSAAIQDYIRHLNERDTADSQVSPFEKGALSLPFVPTNDLFDHDRKDTIFDRSRTWIPRNPYR